MDSLSEIVDVVIGVDTHVTTHSAALVSAHTGAVLAEITVEATPEGYEELVEFADEHSGLRAWAIEGTGGHGAGLARHLAKNDELVVELDRPVRQKRRNGAKSDPLDAIRAAREALSRTKLGTPRSTGERQALSVLLAARNSAVGAAKIARQQLFSLVIAAPEQLRSKLRGEGTLAMAALHHAFVFSPTGTSRRELPQQCCETLHSGRSSLGPRPIATRKRSSPLSAHGARRCSSAKVSDRSSPPRCCAPGRTRGESDPRLLLRCLAVPLPSLQTPAR